jgi:hypothetical protein
MRRLALPLLVALGWIAPAVSFAGGLPAQPPKPAIATRVWTSEEVEALRGRGLISLIGQQPAEVSASAQTPPEAETRTPRPERAKDPEWYAEQAAAARLAMEVARAEARRVRRELGNARYWEGGLNLAGDNTGITPVSELEILETRSREEEERIDALADQARRNGIPPGALR